MGWNGSNSGSSAVVKDGGRKPSAKAAPSFKKGIIAGLIVIIGAGVVAWWIGRGGSPSRPQEKKPATKQIAEVKPQIVTQSVDVAELKVETPKENVHDPKARPTKVGEIVNGYIMMSSGEVHKMTGQAHSLGETPDPSQIFDNAAENEIASLITLMPGSVIVGGPDPETFIEDFLKSTRVPIVVKEDDPDEVKELKRAVNQVKIELKLAHDRGEDITDIVAKTYEDFQKLEQYKEDISSEVLDYSENEEATDEDVATYIAAANKMLEEKGIPPLDDNEFIRTKIEYDHNILKGADK